MASLSKDKTSIQFVGADRKRRTIRLSKLKLTKKAAETIKGYVEALNSAVISGTSWDRETAEWVGRIEPQLYDKLFAVGLVPKRTVQVEAETKAAADKAAAAMPRLGAFLDSYIVGRTDVKDTTATVYDHTRRCLVDYFTAEKPLGEVTPGDTDDWRLWLANPEKGEGLAPNTVRRRCGIAKQFFRAAVRRKLISENPFADMKGNTIKSNRERFHFVSREDADKVLAACPDAEWQLIFALSRYGGLRCPSEHLRLTWGDVDFERGRMHVRSPKTEHHEGKESRMVPVFPELRPYLQAVLDELLEDFDPKAERLSEQPLITRYRNSNANLRTQLLRILKRAGVKPWEKLFQNLRSTRQTELAERFPMHVVCEWIGNSQLVAKEHYLQVTDAHFAAACQSVAGAIDESAALGESAGSGSEAVLGGTRNELAKTSQRAWQSATSENARIAGDFRPLPPNAGHDANYCTANQVGDEGLEPPTFAV